MSPDFVIDLSQQALRVTSLLAAPVLIVALLVGLLVGMFQAATQINENTLSFIPKLFAMAAVLFVAGPWMLNVILTFTHDLIASVPQMLR
ncbi:MAG: flagellar biosynthesis protein FliQ [Pseudomonadota bacterium]